VVRRVFSARVLDAHAPQSNTPLHVPRAEREDDRPRKIPVSRWSPESPVGVSGGVLVGCRASPIREFLEGGGTVVTIGRSTALARAARP
jgi:hypothetical protein